METSNSINQAHVDEILDLINSFNYDEHINDEGIAYRRENKPNMSRVKMVLEDLLFNKGENLSFSDQQFLMEIFSLNFNEFLKEHYSIIGQVQDKDQMLIFIQDLYERIHGQMRAKYEIKRVIFTIQQELLKNTSEKLSPKNLQAALKKNSAGKIVESYANQKASYALIKTNDSNYYRMDISNNKVLQSCGESLEKAYSFQDNKIFVFEQHGVKTKEQVKGLIESFLVVSNNTSLKSFMLYLQEQYDIKKESLKSFMDEENDGIDLADVYEAKGDVFVSVLLQLLNHGHIVPHAKNIYMLNQNTGFTSLGTRKSIDKPTLLIEGYKGIPGVQIPVVDKKNKKHIIISNGQEQDSFEAD